MFAQTEGGRGCGRGAGQGGCGSVREVSRTNTNNSKELVLGIYEEAKTEIAFFGCHGFGHYAGECQYQTWMGINCAHIICILTQDRKMAIIQKSWILLDTCSAVSVGNNGNFLIGVRDCQPDEVLTAITNGGSQFYKQLANLATFPITVHFKHDSIANILSFKDVSSIPGTRITISTEK